jgi:putative DNA primase/helicase
MITVSVERIPCPVHYGRDANCSVWRDQQGKVHAKCWSHGCPEREIVAVLGESVRQAARIPDSLFDDRHSEYARRLLRESHPAADTLAQNYLRSRGLTMRVPPSLRFHSNLRHPTGAKFPAMVGCVQNCIGQIVAIHRTFLNKDGSGKANVQPAKMMLGPCVGCAVRFAKPASVIAIAEGIETALSIAQACPHLAVWAALSAPGIRALQLPEVVQELIICADNDPNGTGERAAKAAAMRFVNEGRKVRIALPTNANDFNDLLRT